MSVVGIDIGALFLKAVRLDEAGRVLASVYERHRGEPAGVLAEAFDRLGVQPDEPVGLTGSNGELFALQLKVPYRDVTLCQIDAVRRLAPDAAAIMDIGGGSATLIHLDGQGKFQGYSSNSLCAAGTGSFLDEQAGRLGISYDEARGFRHNPNPPTVATRCSVFAKSDLIHRQQEGCSRMDMWSGLCRGMTRTVLGTLLNGRPLEGKTVLVGGVALNQEVVAWLKKECAGLIEVPEHPHLLAARGAALAARPAEGGLALVPARETVAASGSTRFPWPLTLEKSTHPSFATQESYEDEDRNEVRVTRWSDGETIRAYLGIDIGSTSTKLILVDEAGGVVADIYRKTGGDPIGATKLLFRSLRALAAAKGSRLDILGAGTTGSGRKIVGHVIGADAIINEISAHVAGAAHVDPTIDTIFEIGGQDAKYMHLVDGHIRDANMNYVCAAGTGSFVEEQALKLGYTVSEAGPAVMGLQPPRATDRCTVFMEQDLGLLIRSGCTPQEAFAAVMVSVVKNYLNKVVGNRYRSRDKIFFQGATARNPALVAAFERLLDVEIVVSPYCHVMGAYGVALLTQRVVQEQGRAATAFRGLDLDEREIRLSKQTCDLCNNHCGITLATIDGEAGPSWGYMCGREPGERRMRVTPHSRLLRRRRRDWLEGGRGIEVPDGAPVIGIPQALSIYTYLPLWRRFFNALGYRVLLSGGTTQAIRELGGRMSGAEFCFPAKSFLGHVASLAAKEGVDFVFLPEMKNEVPNEHVTTSTFCPYVQASPSYARAALALNAMDTVRLLAPIIDLRLSERTLLKRLASELGGPLGRSPREIAAAWRDGYAAQRAFEQRLRDEGARAIEQARAAGEKLLVLIGRPYNLYDSGLNLDLPDKLAEFGRTVLPIDFLTLDLSRLGERYRNTYWGYGQKILAALEDVASNGLLDAVYFTNFSCGPDSFLLSYASEIMGNKPFLALELDEHGSDTGYMTRIEAFFDVLRRPRKDAARRRAPVAPASQAIDGRTLWVPDMHPYSTEFVAAAFRGQGYRARALPLETEETFELGRSLTRGSECLPTALTIGSLLTAMRTSPPDEKHAYFLATAQGPCRFGQYVTLHRQILDREGFPDVPILAPTSFTGYSIINEAMRKTLFKVLVTGDLLMKAGCRVRPYERETGETNYRLERARRRIVDVLEGGGDVARELAAAVRDIASVPRKDVPPKPLVGIVGEIYVRNNAFANEHVVQSIEKLGAEAWMVPLIEWILFVTSPYNVRTHLDHKLSKAMVSTFLTYKWMQRWERKLYRAASPLLDDRHEPPLGDVLEAAMTIMPDSIGGEALLTVGRTIAFARQQAAMVVNVAPFSCMPGTITTALFRKVSADTGMPIVNMFYDGTGGQNRSLEVYLRTALNADSDHLEDGASLAGRHGHMLPVYPVTD
ncbi:MAG TPA: acyl-CoA dehydratase activase [Vicinamibacterales bacterium]|nr:acyl-CoA dehydratase activase [Vicinamibacterales bacterium]